MKKQFFLISSLIMAVTASAWWVFSPGDAAPQLVVRLNGIALPAHRADPAAKAQQLVSLSDEARAELFRPGGRFEFSPVAGLSLSVEVERPTPSSRSSRRSWGALIRLPLCPIANGPSSVSKIYGWVLRSLTEPVVE